LDFAIAHGIPHGGWCPSGRLAEDGRIDLRYELKETPSIACEERTEWNVRDSDGTVVLSIEATLSGGARATVGFAHQHEKPVLHLSLGVGATPPEQALLRFIREHRIRVLNVAGPRASSEPAVAGFVREVLEGAWRAL